jgi:hypothetical protein
MIRTNGHACKAVVEACNLVVEAFELVVEACKLVVEACSLEITPQYCDECRTPVVVLWLVVY